MFHHLLFLLFVCYWCDATFLELYIYIYRLAKTRSDIYFLSSCKRLDVIPNGLKLKNPLRSTFPHCNSAEEICRRASEKLRNLALRGAYRRQNSIGKKLQSTQSQLLSLIGDQRSQINVKEFLSSCYQRTLSQKLDSKHEKLVKLSGDNNLPGIRIPRNRPVRQSDLRGRSQTSNTTSV